MSLTIEYIDKELETELITELKQLIKEYNKLKRIKSQINMNENPKTANIIYKVQTINKLLLSPKKSNHKIKQNILTPAEKIKSINQSPTLEVDMCCKKHDPQQNSPLPTEKIRSINQSPAIKVNMTCKDCKETDKLYGKFINDPQIDINLQKKGFKPLPPNLKLKCKCGKEHDLKPQINKIEKQSGKKIILKKE